MVFLHTHCLTDDSNMQVLNCNEEIIFRDGPSKRYYEKLSGSYPTSIDFLKTNKQIAFLLFYNEGNSFWEINIIASVSFLFCEPSSEMFLENQHKLAEKCRHFFRKPVSFPKQCFFVVVSLKKKKKASYFKESLN